MLRARVDVDAGVAVGVLGQHARHERHLAALQLVRQPVDGDGEEAGIGEDHLVDGVRGGVAVADRLGVEQQRRADVREGGEEPLDDIVRVGAVRLGQPQRVDQQRAQRGELVRHAPARPPTSAAKCGNSSSSARWMKRSASSRKRGGNE